MSSLLTNESAMVALSTLRMINKDLAMVQNQVSTGKTVASASDNAAIWAVATTMETDVASFDQISNSLGLASATVGVALGAAESLTDVLEEMKELAVQAQEDNVDLTTIQNDLDELILQLDSIVNAAQFNGLNMVDNTTAVQFLSSLDRDSGGTVTASFITVNGIDLSTTGDLATVAAIDVTVDAAQALTDVEAAIQITIDAAASFGSAQRRIDIQDEFVNSLTDNMQLGISALVDADMEEASARLQSLQVQQQLGVQALAIANAQPQTLLSLFQ